LYFLVLRLCSLIVVSDWISWWSACGLWLWSISKDMNRVSWCISDWSCWCSICGLWLCFLVLHLCSLIGLAGAPFWENLWSLWYSVCGLWLYFVVLRLCSLIGLAGAPFWQNLWSLWCSVCGLWFYFFLQSAHGDKDSRNWPTIPWTGSLPKVFFGTFPGAPFGPFWCLC